MDGADRCYVIGGGFTLIGMDDSTDFEWFEPASLLEVKDLMDRGEFDEVDPDIVAVQFVNGTITLPERGTLPPNIVRGSGSETEGNDNNEVWPWIVLGIGVLFFFLAVYGMNRWAVQRKERIDAENESLRMGVSSSSTMMSNNVAAPPPATKTIKSKKEKRLTTVPEVDSSQDVASVDSTNPVIT